MNQGSPTTISPDQAIDLYKIILEQESSNHTIFISILLGIAALALGITWWWNRSGAIEFIKKEIETKIAMQKAILTTELNENIDKKIDEKLQEAMNEYNRRLVLLEADLYRAFAFSLDNMESYSYSIYYWAVSMSLFVDLDDGILVRASAEQILTCLKDNQVNEIHGLESVKSNIEKLPSTLTNEKNQILDLLKKCSDI